MAALSFIMHIKHHECECGNIWESSDLFQITVVGDTRRLDPFIGMPTTGHAFGISHLPHRRVAVCHECGPRFARRREQEIRESLANWEDTLRRKAAQEPYSRIHFTGSKERKLEKRPLLYIPSAEEL